ncbi:MAG: adenylate/guanylate cyclase domain-containing protein [Deltaproteobacteria bacterium]|nr:adenylate/guanylate cyclase domain-containing protein [Deltaproteobacteria bacterium]
MNIRQLRLVTGVILFTYLTTHLLNHTLGLISLDAMEAGRVWFLALWRNWLGTTALYGALLTHLGLAFYALYQRQHLRMPLTEALQLALGLTIPILLIIHVVFTRLAHEWYAVNDSYASIVLTLWHADPWAGLLQESVLIIAWLHGCIGLHYWLRLHRWYGRYKTGFLIGALLLPLLALLGFADAGKQVSDFIARDPEWIDKTLQAANAPRGAARASLIATREWLLQGFVALLVLVLAARLVRQLYQRRHRIKISYPSGVEVAVPRGLTVLEASRLWNIPHTSICGGRGRCSTCRVRVMAGADLLPPAKPAEQRVLQRVGAPLNVRLACQLRPTADLAVAPLIASADHVASHLNQPGYAAGEERNIAVLFADLRTFTGLAERKLPYDLVFILNSYFKVAGEAVTGAGGVVDKFIGDGVMALFGLETNSAEGCRQALAAAKQMCLGIETLNKNLSGELHEPLRIGIGIHHGPAVVGRMGYGATVHLTAIGDTVNVASRLQDLTKEYACQLVISEQVARHAGVEVAKLPRHELNVRNHNEATSIYVVADVPAWMPTSKEG